VSDFDVLKTIDSDYAHAVGSFCGIFHLRESQSGLPECASLSAELALASDHDFQVVACFPSQGGGVVVLLERYSEDHPAYAKGYRWYKIG